MNFSFTRGDNREHVLENYSRMAAALGVKREKMVLTWQTHTTNIRVVSEDDLGKGVVKERDYRQIDGLLNEYAGCDARDFLQTVCRYILWIRSIVRSDSPIPAGEEP